MVKKIKKNNDIPMIEYKMKMAQWSLLRQRYMHV